MGVAPQDILRQRWIDARVTILQHGIFRRSGRNGGCSHPRSPLDIQNSGGTNRGMLALQGSIARLGSCSRIAITRRPWRYTVRVRRRKGAAASAAGNWMVGPPSSWSLRDQEDASCAAHPAGSPHGSSIVGERSPAFSPTTRQRIAVVLAACQARSRYQSSSVPGVSPPRLSRSDTFASSNGSLRWRRDAVQDCARVC